MFSQSFLNNERDLINFALTSATILWLVSELLTHTKRLRDLCRAYRPSEGLALLLLSAFMIPITWVAAAVLYCHNLLSLWHIMGNRLKQKPINVPAFTILQTYHYFLLLYGIYGLAISVSEIVRNPEVFKDLWMIVRSYRRRRQVVEDTEAQCGLSDPDKRDTETGIPSPTGNGGNATLVLDDEDVRGNAHESNEDAAGHLVLVPMREDGNEDEAAWPENDSPVVETINRTVDHPILLWAASSML